MMAERQSSRQRTTQRAATARRAVQARAVEQEATEREAVQARAAEQEATEREAARARAAEQEAARRKAAERLVVLHRAAEQVAAQLEGAEREAAELGAEEKAAALVAGRQPAAKRVAAFRRAAERVAAQLEVAEREAAELETAIRVATMTAVRLEPPTSAQLERARAAEREAARARAAEQEAVRRKAAEREAASEQALTLSISRELVEASNAATAALEADAAYSKLAHSRLRVNDLPFFDEQAQLDREQHLAQMMITAGRGLVDAFTDLLNARTFWDRVAGSENETRQALTKAAYSFRLRMELAELLTHHIPEMLLNLGYRPPPPTEIWADGVQNSVQQLLTVDEDTKIFAQNSAKAQQELIFFTRRLRALVETAEQGKGADEGSGKPRSSRFLHSLRSVISQARSRAIPAALAAGAGAAVVGAGGGPAVMGMTFLSSSAASLLGTATEAAATAWLAQEGLHGDTPVMSTSRVVQTDIEALDECIELMRSPTRNTESIRFIIRRGVFQMLQDATDYPATVRDSLWNTSQELLVLVDSQTFPIDEAHQIVRSVREIIANASDG
jgi:hypothetical protein